jgi:hypothetical protein
VQTIPEQIQQARAAFAEAPDERARMGRISGVLWMAAAVVGVINLFVPGSHHVATPLVLLLGAFVFLYGFASVAGWIPWDRSSGSSPLDEAIRSSGPTRARRAAG